MGAGPLPERCACPCGGGSEQMAEGTLSCGPLLFTHKSGPLGFLDRPDRREVPGVVSWLTQRGPSLSRTLPVAGGTLRCGPAWYHRECMPPVPVKAAHHATQERARV